MDWGLALGFAGGALGIDRLEPRHTEFRLDDPAISRELKKETVPSAYLALAAAVPLTAFGLAQIWGKSWHDFHNATLGLAEAISLTLFITAVLKINVGRLRPDFLERCQPNASLECQGDPAEVREGRKSFPSGHSSISFAGGVFLSLYLWGKLSPLSGPGAFWKIPVILAPIMGAAVIAGSRVTDNRHHWEDVFVGALLGGSVSVLTYLINYPTPWGKNAGKPRRRKSVVVAPIVTRQQAGLALQGTF
ncbi:MAG: phosphatase PAP2 family protein [bacterium]